MTSRDFKGVIDIDHKLKELDCSLQDILNVYRIYHNKMPKISKSQLIRCDKIILGLGFDKEWSEYYYNSRNIKNGMARSEYIRTHEESSVSEFDYTIG